MTCHRCQRENPREARFCNGCGSPLERVCSACSHANPADAGFCNSCGASLVSPERQPKDRGRDPRAYTPERLAERILESRSMLEGERKHVTVFFCDLANSTPIAESIGAEAMHELMDRCFALVLAQVHRYEGTVNQFLGDGVMALFGAPLAIEDAPRRAVTAALAVQRSLEPLAEELERRHGIEFRMRVGIHSGPVVVGRIGDDLRMDYTAIGDTVNLADRLQGLAPVGGVLISAATRNLVSGYFELDHRGALPVKGKADPVDAYLVLAEREERGRVEARAESGLTPLVGRARELEALEGAFELVCGGKGQVVFLVGEAGIGKSRLRYEFSERLAGRPHRWAEGRCMSYARDFPFHPLVDALRRQFGIDETDGDAAALAKIEAYESDLGGGLEWTLPHLRTLLSLPTDDPDVEALDAATRRSETFRALRARIQRASEQAPFVLVIEDIHWIDRASEEFLAYLVDSIPTSRVLLLLTNRPGYQHSFGDKSYHLRLSLQPLSNKQMARMAELILESAAVPSTLRARISARAEGNPFFVEEVIRSLVEEGALRQRDGRVELTREVESISVPESIHDVLMARLDRLDDEPKRALQIGAVIGREFAMRLLERISESGARLQPVIDELRAVELIYEKAAHPELAFMFKHALTRDVAYDSLLVSRRKRLHRIVGLAIEELYVDRLAEHVEHLAHHFFEGEEWGKAYLYAVRAAQKAAAAFANQSAVEHCRRALEIAERLGDAVDAASRRELEELRGSAAMAMSEFQDSGSAFLRAAELSDQPSNRALNYGRASHSFFWAHMYEPLDRAIDACAEVSRANDLADGLAFAEMMRGFRHAVMGELGEFGRLMESAERREPTHPEVLILLRFLQGQADEWSGNYRGAVEAQLQGVEVARKYRLPGLLVPGQWFHGKALCCLGDYGASLTMIHDAYDLAARIGDRHQRARMLNTLGWVHAEVGAYGLAADYNRRSIALAEEMLALGLVAGTPEIHGNACVNLSTNHVALGEFELAEEALAPVREDLESSGDPWMRWRYSIHWHHAEAVLALGRRDLDGAMRHIELGLEGARHNGTRKLVARELELKARAHVLMDAYDAAHESLEEAVTVADEIGYRPVRWRALSLRRELARRSGDRASAENAGAEARSLVEQGAATLRDSDLRARLVELGRRLESQPLEVTG